MKHLFFVLTVLLFTTVEGFPGVGGMSGGHIQFQKESTFVHPLYHKSLCYDGDSFHAKVNKCVEWKESGDKSTCVRTQTVWAEQPRESKHQRCARSAGDDGTCLAWEEVPLVQNPDRYFEFADEDGRVTKRVEFRVKDCRE